jgi:hypothetical protein
MTSSSSEGTHYSRLGLCAGSSKHSDTRFRSRACSSTPHSSSSQTGSARGRKVDGAIQRQMSRRQDSSEPCASGEVARGSSGMADALKGGAAGLREEDGFARAREPPRVSETTCGRRTKAPVGRANRLPQGGGDSSVSRRLGSKIGTIEKGRRPTGCVGSTEALNDCGSPK